MIRGSVVMLALLFNAPLIWRALADQTASVDDAAIHFLVTVPVVAVLLALVRAAMSARDNRAPRSAARRGASSSTEPPTGG